MYGQGFWVRKSYDVFFVVIFFMLTLQLFVIAFIQINLRTILCQKRSMLLDQKWFMFSMFSQLAKIARHQQNLIKAAFTMNN